MDDTQSAESTRQAVVLYPDQRCDLKNRASPEARHLPQDDAELRSAITRAGALHRAAQAAVSRRSAQLALARKVDSCGDCRLHLAATGAWWHQEHQREYDVALGALARAEHELDAACDAVLAL